MQGGRNLRSIQYRPNQDARHHEGCDYASDESRTTDRTVLDGYPGL